MGDFKTIESRTESAISLLKKNIHYLRKKVRGLTFEELAGFVGVSRDSLFRLENDKDRMTNLKTLVRITLFFNVSMDDLLFTDLEYESMKREYLNKEGSEDGN